MTVQNFTDVFIRQVSCNKDSMIYRDKNETGLCLRVSHTGRKTFSHVYSINKKQRRMTIGNYPIISLKDARKTVIQNKVQILDNIDPQTTKNVQHTHNACQSLTIKQGFDIFIRDHIAINTKSEQRYTRIFNQHVPADIQNIPIMSLKRSTIRTMLSRMSHIKRQANILCSILKACFTWLWNYEYIELNPIMGLPKSFENNIRNRVLSDSELRAVFLACTEMGYPNGHMTQITLLTGQRRMEVATMRWADINIVDKIWTIPAERCKNGKQHQVPLSDACTQVISACLRNGVYVFSFNGMKPIGNLSDSMGRLQRISDTKDWAYHDLRRTLATNLSKNQQINDIVISAILNHSTQKLQGVTSIYNTHTYMPERREALQTYGQWVMDLVDGKPNDETTV